jgi:hypothetical protein
MPTTSVRLLISPTAEQADGVDFGPAILWETYEGEHVAVDAKAPIDQPGWPLLAPPVASKLALNPDLLHPAVL